jgi:hypothetical protein
MPKAAARTDEYTLLCERCGYVVDGLDTDGVCPECGKPIAESRPRRRTGSAWQRRPGMGALWRTWPAVLAAPNRTLDTLIVGHPHDRRLARLSAVLAAAIPCGAIALALGVEGIRTRDTRVLAYLGLAVAAAPALWLVVRALIGVETKGLRVIGRTRGFRVTPAIAATITAHGAVGWVIAGAGVAIAVLGPFTAHLINSAAGTVDGPVGRLGALGVVLGLLLTVFGFLFFETFAWLGIRRLKYANRARPGPAGQAAS